MPARPNGYFMYAVYGLFLLLPDEAGLNEM